MQGSIWHEILNLHDEVRHIRIRVDGHDEQFKSIRHMLVALQSDNLRHEATVSQACEWTLTP